MGEQKNMARWGNIMGQFERIFKAVDKDGNGSIDKAEAKEAFKKIGAALGGAPDLQSVPEEMANEVVEQMFKDLDIDGDGKIDFEECKLALRNAPGTPEDPEGELEKAPD